MTIKTWTIPRIIMPVIAGSIGTLFLGRVSLIEILALIWLVFARGHIYLPLLFQKRTAFLGCFYLSAAALLFSDIINQTPLGNSLKGVGAYLLLPTLVLFLLVAFDKDQLWLLFLSASIFGVSTNSLVSEVGFNAESFKFGYSIAATYTILTLALALSKYPIPLLRSRLTLSIASTLAIGSLGAWGNLRLLSLCALLSIVVYLLHGRLPLLASKRITDKKVLFMSLAVVPIYILITSIVFSSLVSIFIVFIPDGLINADALQKTFEQSGGQLGILFGGRSEIFSSFLAWFDKPFWGWGSWAADPGDHYNLSGKIIMNQLGYNIDYERFVQSLLSVEAHGLIPTHSVLLNLLVWAGAIGFLPVYISVCQYILNGIEAVQLDRTFSFPYVYAYSYSLWSIFFSPFGYSNRVGLSFLMALSIAWNLSVHPGPNFLELDTARPPASTEPT